MTLTRIFNSYPTSGVLSNWFEPLDFSDFYNADSSRCHNLVKHGNDEYELSLVVTGFKPEEVKVTLQDGSLHINAERSETGENKQQYLRRGFKLNQRLQQSFSLGENVEVTSADISDGLLTVKLKKQQPESSKPVEIQIGSSAPQSLK